MRSKVYSLLPLFCILVIAYLIRIIKPSVFISDVDYPGHIVATMRLFLSSFFEFKKLSANFFVQLASFRHGFTTMLVPYFLYAIFFSLLKISVTETHLVIVNSLLGIFSIASLYFFIHTLYGKRAALFAAILYSIIPIHIGLSRIHVGNQIIQSIFFPLSLGFLLLYFKNRYKWYLFLYYFMTFFYIGSDNGFFVGLFIQIIFIIFFHEKNVTHKKAVYQITLNRYYILCVLLPAITYVAIDVIRIIWYGVNAPGGFIFRSVGKMGQVSFDFIKPIVWSVELLGPLFIVGIMVILFYALRNKMERKEQFFVLWIGLYLLLLSISSNIERNYIFYIVLPLCALSGYYLQNKRWIVIGTIIITLLYSSSVIFRFPLGFSVTSTYGSIDFEKKNNDYGVKTLGYLVRKQLLTTRLLDAGNKVKKLNIYMDFLGGWYYTSDYYFDKPVPDLVKADPKSSILIYRPNMGTPGNGAISSYIKKYNLKKFIEINSDTEVLLELYSTENISFRKYNTHIFNLLFDKEFGNIQSIAKLHLGIY